MNEPSESSPDGSLWWWRASQRACSSAAAVMSTAVAALLPSVESLMSADDCGGPCGHDLT